jgi:hypothetical protein
MPRLLALLLLAVLLTPSGAANIRVKTQTGGSTAGSVGAAGSSHLPTGTAGLSNISLVPTLSAPLAAPLTQPGALPTKLLAPAAASERDLALPQSEIRAAAQAEPQKTPEELGGPQIIGGDAKTQILGAENPFPGANQDSSNDNEASPESNPGQAVLQGRVQFDGAAKSGVEAAAAVPTFGQRLSNGWQGFKNLIRPPDHLPAVLKSGAKVRVAGRTYILDRELSGGAGVTRYTTRTGGDNIVLLFTQAGASAHADELGSLRLLEQSGIPHAKLLSVSADAQVVVQQHPTRYPTAAEILKTPQRAMPSMDIGYFDFSESLLRAGLLPDLNAENLRWESFRTSWLVLNARGTTQASGLDILDSVLNIELLKAMGTDSLTALRALRARLDPYSQQWLQLAAAAPTRGSPEVQAAFTALGEWDAKHGFGKSLSFSASTTEGALNDSILSARKMAKRLGYDPETVKPRYKIPHDEGKSTQLTRLEPKGHPKAVHKETSQDRVQSEILMRKVIHRWFAEYFESPWAVGKLIGHPSVLVMELVEGANRAFAGPKMSRERHIALGVLANAFGLYDMNAGNVFYGEDRVVLIDFEQALGLRGPVSGRLPDSGMLQELPWVNNKEEPLETEEFFEAVRAWRAFWALDSTQADMRQMFTDTGYTAEQTAHYMRNIDTNTRRLTATLQSDVEFANRLNRR